MNRSFFPGTSPLFFLLLIILPVMFSSCGKKPEQTGQHLTYRLKWLFNVSVAGDLFAREEGYFAAQGLAVKIKEGGPERDAIKELEIGRAQFGVASADQVIRAVSRGAPIVVIAQLFQINPLQWVYRQKETAIQSPQDLKDKTIGVTFGGNDETIMRALLAKYAISEDEVRLFSVRYDYSPFYEGKVDLWPVYSNAQGIIISDRLARQDEQVRFFNPDRYGVRFVANSVITSQKMLTEHPRTVEKFMTALLRGWRTALSPANADQTVQLIHTFDRETPVDIIRRQLDATRALMEPEQHFGSIDTEAWEQTARIMLTQHLIEAPVNVSSILHPLVTTRNK